MHYDPSSPGTSMTSPGEAELLGVIGLVLGLVCVGSMGWEEFKFRRASSQEAVVFTAARK